MPKCGQGGDGAIRGRLDEPLQASADELLLLLDGRRCDALGGKHERNEDGGAFVVRQTFAAVNQLFNCDVHGIDAGTGGEYVSSNKKG